MPEVPRGPGAARTAAGSAHPPAPEPTGPEQPAPEPTAQLLCDVPALAGRAAGSAGAVWKLAEPGRQLDANVIHLPSRHHVAQHAEPDLDVLLLVVSGDGTLGTPVGTERLTPGALFWLPHGSSRDVTAGEAGLSYLTVHRRRPGMQIRTRPGPPAGPATQDG